MLEGLTPPRKEPICPMMANATQKLDSKDLKIFVDAINNPVWGANRLAEQVTERGFYVSDGQILKHRRGTCACAK
jgi:hypothetical protein